MKKFLARFFYCAVFGNPQRPPESVGLELSEIERILVIRDDHIGDLILSTPAFEALKAACPQAKLTLVASSYNADVVQGNPYIDRILCYEKHKHSSNEWRVWSTWEQYRFLKSLRKEKFDLAIGLRSRFRRRQSQTVFACGAPYRLGHHPDRPRDRHLGFFYNIYVSESRVIKHEVERTLDVLKAIGVEQPLPRPLVVIEQSEDEFASATIAAREIKGAPKIGYHISNRKAHLIWPLTSFAQLMESLRRSYPTSEHIITFAPGDQERANHLAALLKNRVHVVGTRRIKQLGAIQRHCQLFITLDGAPMHLAASVGTPTLAIFGYQRDIIEWHPWGPQHRWLVRDKNIEAISPDEVYEVAIEMLEESA